MMMYAKQSFITTVLVAVSSISAAMAGGHNVLSVEPYIAEWCAAQFPEQITDWTGYNEAHLVRFRDYVRIEPYMGRYCFDEFPTELKDQKREETLQKMATKHVQIEPFFMRWLDASMVNPTVGTRVELEPYLAQWCVEGQFKLLMSNPAKSLSDAAANPIHPEGAMARWCFAEFAGELSSLDEEQTVANELKDHVKIEQYLIKWAGAVYGARQAEDHPNTKKAGGIGFGVGFAIALAILLPIWGLCWWRSRRSAAKDAHFHDDVQMTQDAIMKESDSVA
ncbi:expressed unknown protein [Seminavis robusta]|uniref:Uncharacterized protein n=1 Tax=Seminavis robusta TaxID=568900 RepID=A0A9N8E7Z7_9STRA|nr:expressed unknown protein [Seminavis robusta]|eukprot:Sro594_g172480.1 n/a (279) ;mRNA; f:32223-33209